VKDSVKDRVTNGLCPCIDPSFSARKDGPKVAITSSFSFNLATVINTKDQNNQTNKFAIKIYSEPLIDDFFALLLLLG
jgi:hypothetical protein